MSPGCASTGARLIALIAREITVGPCLGDQLTLDQAREFAAMEHFHEHLMSRF